MAMSQVLSMLGLSDEIRRMSFRQIAFQILNFAMIVSSALMIWKGLMVLTGSGSPIVVVLSGTSLSTGKRRLALVAALATCVVPYVHTDMELVAESVTSFEF